MNDNNVDVLQLQPRQRRLDGLDDRLSGETAQIWVTSPSKYDNHPVKVTKLITVDITKTHIA